MTGTIPGDGARLRVTADFVRDQDTATLLPLLLPGLSGPELRALTEHCRFAHAALAVFPPDHETLRADLAACGLPTNATPRPSTVVRARVAARYRREETLLDVRILRPSLLGRGGERRVVEVFALTVPPGSAHADIAVDERVRENEAHLAFEIERPDPLVLHGLRAVFARHGAVAEGGGYNPHENGTVFYFTAPPESKAGYRRVELYAPGDHSDVLALHLAELRTRQPAEALLRLLTGAWTTQALATFATLGLPDAMDPETGTELETLARQVGAHPDSLATLLRYLTMLGAVARDRTGFRLTPVGALLREDDPYSMRPLALMYGGTFYQSFAELGYAVRTGQEAFAHRFGEDHFSYFARRPELAELFHRSMAASARMFDPVPTHPVLTAAAARESATVVDVAGGNGELLGRVLTAHPRLRGVLLERPHAIAAARTAMAAAGCASRCTYQAGDFADVPAGGDVYVLSRVLHDWDDERCREILRHCAAAMPAHADLLILERVLPTDDTPSLATAWDLHMMCNVGGRERRADHYARLLADAGFELLDHTPLPLDGSLLHARKADAA